MERDTSTLTRKGFCGNIPICQDLHFIHADDSQKLKIGFTIKEEIGPAFYNSAAMESFNPIPLGVVTVEDEKNIETGFFPKNLRLFE